MNRNQRGFSIVEGLLAAIVIILLVGVGYYVYSSQQDKKDSDKTTTTIQAEKKATTTTTKPADSTKYLEIKEMGVKIPLTDKIADAYYEQSKEGYVYVSIHYFDSVKGFEGCRANPDNEELGIAAVSKAKIGEDSGNGTAFDEEIAKNVNATKIGDTYYWITGGNGACYNVDDSSTKSAAIDKFGETRDAFIGLSSKIVKL